jgi:hypothetical protein
MSDNQEKEDALKESGPSELFSIVSLVVSLLGLVLSPLFLLAGLVLSGRLIIDLRESGKKPNGMVVASGLIAVFGITMFIVLIIAAWLLSANIDFAGVSIGFSSEKY